MCYRIISDEKNYHQQMKGRAKIIYGQLISGVIKTMKRLRLHNFYKFLRIVVLNSVRDQDFSCISRYLGTDGLMSDDPLPYPCGV